MKIGYCVPRFPAQTHAFFWREIEALEAEGTAVRIISTRRPGDEECPHAFAPAARARTLYLFPPDLRDAAGLLARRAARLPAAARYVAGLSEGRGRVAGLIPVAAALCAACRREGIGHVHIHSCADAAHLGALAHILDGLSYSLTLHGDLPVYGADHAAKMARASLVTAVTAPLAAQIREIQPGREIPVITMGVDVGRFSPLPEAEGAAEGAAEGTGGPGGGPLRVATVARLNPTKGHLHFLHAMARGVAEGMDLRWRIAGDGPHRAALEAAIAETGLGDRVELLGSLGEAEVLALLRGSDVFALTSFGRGEAAPVSVMEAMACGVPAICSRIGGTQDMIRDGVDGLLVAQKDEDGLLGALRRLVGEAGLRPRLAAAARERAVSTFDHRIKARELRDALVAAGSLRP